MSSHPFPLYLPIAGRTNGPDVPIEQMVRMSRMHVLHEMFHRLRGYVERFNDSESVKTRKGEIEQLGFWRGVHFPELGKVLHPNRIGFGYKNRTVMLQRFIVSDGDIIIQKLNNSSEYEEVQRFPLAMLTLDLKLEQDKEKLEQGNGYEIIVSALWRTGSVESVALDSAQL